MALWGQWLALVGALMGRLSMDFYFGVVGSTVIPRLLRVGTALGTNTAARGVWAFACLGLRICRLYMKFLLQEPYSDCTDCCVPVQKAAIVAWFMRIEQLKYIPTGWDSPPVRERRERL